MAFALALAPATAAAQGNYRLAPVGGRTTLVGGTGLAYGRDSASAYLNPATIVRVDPGRLAFSVNFYSFSLVTAENWYQPGPVDPRFGNVPKERSSITNADFDSLPGSLCLFLRAKDVGFLTRADSKELGERQARLGLCLASVQNSIYAFNAEDYSQVGAFGRSRQAGSIRQTFRRFAIGPSYAMYVDERLAIGASLHFSRASYRSILGNTATTQANGGAPISSAFYSTSRGDSHELSFTFGATYRMRHQTFALAIEAPSLHLFGSGGTNLYTHSDGAPGPDGAPTSATYSSASQGAFAAHTPLRVAIGTGYEKPWGSVELNVSFHAALPKAYEGSFTGSAYQSSGASVSDGAITQDLSTRARGAVNIGVGGEYFLAPQISLLGGLSTDFSSVPQGALNRDAFNYFPAHTHRVAASFGYGSHGDGGDLLIGGEFSYGWGERRAVNAYQLPPQLGTTEERQYTLLFVLAGSTSFKAIRRAVEDVTKVLGPPKPAAPKPERETEPMKTDRQTEASPAGKPAPPKPEPPSSEAPAADPLPPAPAPAKPPPVKPPAKVKPPPKAAPVKP